MGRERIIIFTATVVGIFSLADFVFAATPTYESAPTSTEVLVVYNSSYATDSNSNGTQDSREIAEYYQTKRSIPGANVLGISASTTEEITRTQYNNQIKSAIENYLTASGLKDSIKYIVLTKGVPLKIQFTNNASYGSTDYSSVDSAICLLFETYDITWHLSSPYYNVDPDYTKAYRFKTNHFTLNGVTLRYLVTRLDGYTVADIKAMIDRAAAPNISGTGYWIIDDHPTKGYDQMSTAYTRLKNLNQNVNPDPWEDTTSWITTNPAGSVMGYLSHGVHAGMPDGYVTNNLSFTYLNGAVFSTYESNNAYGFISPTQDTQGQIAEFIGSGGTGGVGHTYEPWVSAVAREEIFMPAYTIGYPWADAVYQSLPFIDFVAVVVGDPLMTIREIVSPGEAANLNAVAGDAQVVLTWTNPSDGDFAGVKILRKTGSYSTHSADGTVAYNSSGISYTDTGLTNGTTYYYTAFARDGVPNYSAGSVSGARATATPSFIVDSTPPGNVSGMSAIAGVNSVSLSWTNPSDADLVGVRILKKTTGYPANSTDGTAVFAGNASSFVDTNFQTGNTNYYTAFAYDEVPNYSSVVSGAQAEAAPLSLFVTGPDTDLPPKPSNFQASAGNTQVSLSWANSTSSDFERIKILRRTDYYPISQTNGTLIYHGTGTSYTNTGLVNGATYFYTIFSLDKVNNSSIFDSTVRSAATPYSGTPISNAVPTSSPSSVFTAPDTAVVFNVTSTTAVVSSGRITLSWADPFDDEDWNGTKLVRKIGSYPGSVTDGVLVYDGQASVFIDTNVQAGTVYYYAAFAYDNSKNYSDGTVSGAKISAIAQ